jgi:hypothetical protein
MRLKAAPRDAAALAFARRRVARLSISGRPAIRLADAEPTQGEQLPRRHPRAAEIERRQQTAIWPPEPIARFQHRHAKLDRATARATVAMPALTTITPGLGLAPRHNPVMQRKAGQLLHVVNTSPPPSRGAISGARHSRAYAGDRAAWTPARKPRHYAVEGGTFMAIAGKEEVGNGFPRGTAGADAASNSPQPVRPRVKRIFSGSSFTQALQAGF